ncbi:hypothetical protein B0H11DRAFT_1902704 [Mycena galericulata]|nr:hypothetical protein B0H11DRAFT_1902704 [Mycena galericulata]
MRRKREKVTHHGSATDPGDETLVDLRTQAAMEDDVNWSLSMGDDTLPLDPEDYAAGREGDTASTKAKRYENSLFCGRCILSRHAALPLHWIEEWVGQNFKRRALKDLGLRVQLGHPPGQGCAFRWGAHDDFTVIHTNGIHNVKLDYCGCGKALEERDQLLDACWWPATPKEPGTCCTFMALRQFQTLNTTGKVSGYDYYRTLEALTDNTGLQKIADRRRPFMRIVREWRNVQMFKRAGRAHDPTGIEGTKAGELAQFCHACPQPGKNLPPGWKNEPKATAYKYFLNAGQDANFRLHGRMVSSDARDPTLGQGLAYFVDKAPYMEHIKNYVNQEEISSCSGFAAMFLANLKRVKGLRMSGVGGVTCTRHNMWLPNGMGDLQKGERYCNMDWVLCSALHNAEVLYIIFTYDISCQYYKNFWDRMRKLPQYLHLNIPPSNIFFYVPNFHLPAHREDCHAPFSLHFAPGAGLANGEGIEQNWENSNGAANQTKQMGPGSRQDTLDDILGAHNYRKTLALGRILLKRLLEANKEAVRQRKAFVAFDAGLESAEPGITKEWAEVEAAWQADRTKECPYRVVRAGKTMKDVELELAREEFEETASNVQVVHESSRSMFVVMGLEIEESHYELTKKRRALELEIKARKAATTYQELDFQKRRNAISKKIERFRQLQGIYMPGLRDELTEEQLVLLTANVKKEVESVKLYLPSALSSERARENACAPRVAGIEARLRLVEATDALEELRRGLRMRTVTNRFKVKNVTGQRGNTRAQGIQHQVDVRIHAAKLRYRYSREAYARLVGSGTWEATLRVLNDEDVRAMNERALTVEEKNEEERLREGGLLNELQQGGVVAAGVVVTGEGHRTLSWIWYQGGSEMMGDSEHAKAAREALRAEWCKARARSTRWHEEVVILEEEMRRSIESLGWVAEEWKRRAGLRATDNASAADWGGTDNASRELVEGLKGYAFEHAETARLQAAALAVKWAPVRAKAAEVLAALEGGQEDLVDPHVAVDAEDLVDDSGERGMYEELD